MQLLELGLVPDPLIRFGIRRICARRLDERSKLEDRGIEAHLQTLRKSAVAERPEAANEQHYEVPARFFEAVLGPRLKYSCCTWAPGVRTLGQAEVAALLQVVERAKLRDGQQILELGCGWGSLTLFMAERFPNANITAVSNSRGQKAFIEQRARERGLHNVVVRTTDVNRLVLETTFDRVVSIEMFEHMRNWETLLERIGAWLKPDGKLFVHIFAHQRYAYTYENRGPSDWMARHFFTGGQMPCEELLRRFDEHLVVTDQWRLSGTHYAKTSNAWLANLDANRDAALEALAASVDDSHRALQRWRIFFMACAELFDFRHGREWGVSHYLLEKRDAP